MSLEVQAVGLRYDRTPILRGVSLTLAAGDIGCLLGPSGCGKTSLLRAIAGLEPITDGQIVVAGSTLSSAGHRVAPERRGIGMVFQDLALLGHLNSLDNVALGLHRLPRGQRRQQASQWLEPFSALDTALRESLALEVRTLLKGLGTTALMVTHAQQEAFAFADRIGVMHDGALLQWDRGYALYHRPANRHVADFIGEGLLLRAQRREGRITLPLGELASAGPDGPVEVLLRPDDILHDDDSPLKARVEARYFRGAVFLYRLRLAGGEELQALVPSHHDHPIGCDIGIRLAMDHVIAYAVDDRR